ncbi:hypothetical protein [Paracraurococcus ruber]|nr:hypothetical protein [Paracraurococcus ruber]
MTPVADPSRYLTGRHLHELRNAFLFAEKQGWPLNTWIAVNFRGSHGWVQGDRGAGQVRRARNRFIKAIRDWCQRNSIPHAFVYVVENPPQGGRGPHMHILQHLPQDNWLALRDSLYLQLRSTGAWADHEFGFSKQQALQGGERERPAKWRPLFMHAEPLGNHVPWDWQREALKRLRYMAKGANPQEVVLVNGERLTLGQLGERYLGFHTKRTLDDNGIVRETVVLRPGVNLAPQGDPRIKKRVGSSRELGQAARREFGWNEVHDLRWLCRMLYISVRANDMVEALRKHNARLKQQELESARLNHAGPENAQIAFGCASVVRNEVLLFLDIAA